MLDTHRDMGDVGRGEDRLSWVDHPLCGRHVSTWLQDAQQPGGDDLVSLGHSHSLSAHPLASRRHGPSARLKP